MRLWFISRRLLLLTTFFISVFFIIKTTTRAQTELTVSMQVEETSLLLSGWASSGAQITFLESGTVIGTTTAENDGSFSKTFIPLEAGIKDFSLYATDIDGQNTSTINYSLALIANTQTLVSNIVLPPTLSLSQETITQNQTLEVSGLATPGSTITLLIEGGEKTSATTSTTDGRWQISFDTTGLSAGLYQVFARTLTGQGRQSQNSKTVYLVINPTSTATPTPSSAVTIEELTVLTPTQPPATLTTPTPTSPTLPDPLAPFDIDGDGQISPEEAVEAMKKWVVLWREEAEQATCDLNFDGVCNLIDFSVLLYYIGK